MRDWHRRLFDELIPLPQGTSYNAYLIRGEEATALIDTADPRRREEFLGLLGELKAGRINYIISNHSEQDHSGLIPDVLELHPEAVVLSTPKGCELLHEHLHIPEERMRAVEDGEALPLGGKTLEFIHAPWVHWPETMLTYLREERILFTCDLFGSHLAYSHPYVVDEALVYEAAKRYYAEIMMPFHHIIRRHLERLREIEIDIIAPSHGPMYRDPNLILKAYERWVSEEVENQAVIVYVSMHGSIEEMVNHLVKALMERGVEVKPFNLTVADIGELAMSLVDAATLIVASPTMLGGPHPAVLYAAHLINMLRPKLRLTAFIVSYGWGDRAVEMLRKTLSGLKAEQLDPVVVRGKARVEDLQRLERLAGEILNRHREMGLVSAL